MGYFQDEFAGRIATKLMQTSLAVRETVVKLFDISNYVVVYVGGTLLVAASADWRLMLPFLGWLCCYALLMRWFVPRMELVSQRQADARSQMTGRIVDSYTNIATVKLFSHSQREQALCTRGNGRVFDPGVSADALGHRAYSVLYALNMALLFAVGATGIGLWLHAQVSTGALAVALALALRFLGMSHWIMWELSALFENIGTVHDGIQLDCLAAHGGRCAQRAAAAEGAR